MHLEYTHLCFHLCYSITDTNWKNRKLHFLILRKKKENYTFREWTNTGKGFVEFPSLEMFKNQLDTTLRNLLLLCLVYGVEQICKAAFPPQSLHDTGKNIPEREGASEVGAAAHKQIPLFQKDWRTVVKYRVFCKPSGAFKVFLCAACLDCNSCEGSNSLMCNVSRSALQRVGYAKDSQIRIQEKTKRIEEGNKVFVKYKVFLVVNVHNCVQRIKDLSHWPVSGMFVHPNMIIFLFGGFQIGLYATRI